MKRSTFLAATAGIGAIFGAVMFIAPEMFFSRYGVSLNSVSSLFGRSLGSSLIAIAVVNWMARNAGDSAALRAILTGNIAVHLFSVILDVFAIIEGIINAQGWGSVILHIVFAGGFTYYLVDVRRASK